MVLEAEDSVAAALAEAGSVAAGSAEVVEAEAAGDCEFRLPLATAQQL